MSFGGRRNTRQRRNVGILHRSSHHDRAGIPVLECLPSFKQCEDPGFKSASARSSMKCAAAATSAGLWPSPESFRPHLRDMIKAGEASGQLDTILTVGRYSKPPKKSPAKSNPR